MSSETAMTSELLPSLPEVEKVRGTQVSAWSKVFSLGKALLAKLQGKIKARGAGGSMAASFLIVAFLTLAAKGVSFFKDVSVAHRFGTGPALDAFMLAFGLVSFTASVLAGGLPEAFLPLYSQLKHRRGLRRAQRLAIQSTLCQGLSLTAVGLVYFAFAPVLVRMIGRGFTLEKQQIAADSLRTLLPFMICQGLFVHLATWLRAGKTFAFATLAPALVPLCIIICLVLSGETPSVRALTIGTNVGALMTVLALAALLMRDMPMNGGWWWRSLTVWEPDTRRVLLNTVPFLLSGLIFSSSTMVDQAMASWLSSGSIVVLGYSDKICGLILGLTAAPASDALFPYFADAVARKDWKSVRQHLLGSAKAILLFAVPMTLVLCALAPYIVQLLFQRGAFDAEATHRVSSVLRFSCLGIPFFILGTLISSIVVSMQAARLTLFLSIGAVVVNAGLNWMLMHWLGVAGIALSTVLVYLLSSLTLLWWVLQELSKRMKAERLPSSAQEAVA